MVSLTEKFMLGSVYGLMPLLIRLAQFNRNNPKIIPLRPENWLDLLFVWSDYCWKEAGEIVERFIGGLRNVD